jgi:glycosyltransferase involved in cell wall biosynthesis
LLDAFKQLLDEGVKCNLVLAGDGPMRAEIESRIASYKLDNAVEITGWVSGDQVKTLLIKSRGMVLPSFAEGLPVVIMEALALRRPVISTYVAGIPELIQHGKNGWLVPPGDVTSLKTAIRSLLDSSASDMETMGQQGYDAVTSLHDINNETRILADLFKKVNA